jgi:hypothetical protein
VPEDIEVLVLEKIQDEFGSECLQKTITSSIMLTDKVAIFADLIVL